MSTTTFELSPELEKYGQQLREWSTSELRSRARAADTTKKTPDDWEAILDTCPVPLGRPDKEGDERARSGAADASGMLPLDIDPKLAWALKFRESFPVDVNRAPKEQLLRVPGLGTKAVDRILSSRRWRKLRLDDVAGLQGGRHRKPVAHLVSLRCPGPPADQGSPVRHAGT